MRVRRPAYSTRCARSLRLRSGQAGPGLAAFLALFVTAGCWVPQEQPILDQFFKFSRLRDKTALAHFATVIFEPLDQGIVTEFTVVGRTPLSHDANGQITAKELTLTAPVKLPNGEVAEKTIVVRMEQQATGWKITAAVIKN